MSTTIVPSGTQSENVNVNQYNNLTIVNVHLSDTDFDKVSAKFDGIGAKNLWADKTVIAFFREHALPIPPLKAY